MVSDDQVRVAGPTGPWATAWRWTAARWAIDRGVVGRFFKYLVLISALLLTLKIVFDCYSYYVARRGIDAELESKKIASLEYLNVLQRRDRALMIESLETRCAERAELAFFRVFGVQKETRLRDYYKSTKDIKDSLVDEITRLGPGLVDVKAAVDSVNRTTFTVPQFRDSLNILPGVDKDDAKYKSLMEQIDSDLRKYDALVLGDPALQDLVRQAQDESKNHWRLEAVRTLEQRLARLKAERDAAKGPTGNDEVLARYGVWTDALTGGLSDQQLLDELDVEIRREDAAALADMDCQRFDEFYQALTGEPREAPAGGAVAAADGRRRISWFGIPVGGSFQQITLWYLRQLLNFFNQPPAAQTLFVTLFMGALGGLTVNVLRLSQLGWWRGQKDPLWGEIFVSPILGALAAFAIFLLGSAGLLLTSDFRASPNGVTALSASFIGLLGFLSGFIYDAAFGRLRRVGIQLFADPAAADPAENAPEDDRSLAQTLKSANASRVAGLLLGHGIGSKLASEGAFTLLVPSDKAVGRMPLETWTELNDQKGDAFDPWYRHHHAAERIGKKDLVGPAAAPKPRQLRLDNETDVLMKLDGDDLVINGTKAIIADIVWKKGVIHILQDEIA
jgi:uncharacterized surface protein with fasciclin (FAS1) repeats